MKLILSTLVFLGALALTTTADADLSSLSCVLNQTKTDAQGVEDSISYLKLPDTQIPSQECIKTGCDSSFFEITPELFPETKISVSAKFDGQIYISFYDKGGIAPAQGKVAFTSSRASGKESVLLSVNVTRGDSFPVKGNSLMISCSVKKVTK